MSNDQERIEVERVVNLVQGFDWQKEKEEFTNTEIKITLYKKKEVHGNAGDGANIKTRRKRRGAGTESLQNTFLKFV